MEHRKNRKLSATARLDAFPVVVGVGQGPRSSSNVRPLSAYLACVPTAYFACAYCFLLVTELVTGAAYLARARVLAPKLDENGPMMPAISGCLAGLDVRANLDANRRNANLGGLRFADPIRRLAPCACGGVSIGGVLRRSPGARCLPR